MNLTKARLKDATPSVKFMHSCTSSSNKTSKLRINIQKSRNVDTKYFSELYTSFGLNISNLEVSQ